VQKSVKALLSLDPKGNSDFSIAELDGTSKVTISPGSGKFFTE
jgi:hypothetical protein